MSKKIDTLLDIQNRMATTKPYLAITDVGTLRQKLKDEQERTRITLDSIERRLSQIGEVHKDDLRTRTLQTSRDLLAFLYEHPCNVDSGRLSIPQIRDQEIQFFLICLESMRKAYFSTKAQAVKQIIAELQAKGLDTRHVSGLAESGWNHTVVQLLAWELAQLAEKLPKEVP